ncbi:triple tyrosine motif-containing protein [Chromatocurvus halotolerans]|nr:triple tyrosine motif-containing protein [Chromatocurvus halotolerans]
MASVDSVRESLRPRKFISFTPDPLRILNGNTITNVLVRADKDFWISSSDEVFQFDGNDVNTFPVIGLPEPKYPESQFEAIIENSNSELFLISFTGIIYKYSKKEKAFTRITPRSPVNKDGIEVMSSYIDDEDMIWIGYSDGSISRFDTRLKTLSKMDIKLSAPIISILGGHRGVHFVDDSGSIIISPKPIDGRGLNYFTCGKALSPFSAGFIGRAGEIFLGTKGDGVWKAELANEKCTLEKAFAKKDEKIGTATIHDISSAWNHRDDLMLISSDSGLFITNKDEVLAIFDRSNSNIGTNEILTARGVGDAGILAGTYTGLKVLKKTNVEVITDFAGNNSPSVVATTTSPQLGTYIADYSHVYKLSQGTREVSIQEVILSTRSARGIMSLEANHENLWIGFRNGHLLRYTPSSGEVATYSTDFKKRRMPPISAIYAAKDGVIYIGTFGGGVYSLSNNLIKPLSSENTLSKDKILQITRFRGIGIVAFTERGTQLIDIDGEEETVSRKRLSMLSDLPIWSSDESQTSRWLVTPKHGVYLQTRNELGEFSSPAQVVPEELLKRLVIYAALVDRDDIAYISSNRGIFKRLRDGTFHKVLKGSISNSVTFDFGASGVDEKDNILFGGTGGLVRIGYQEGSRGPDNQALRYTKTLVNGVARQIADSDFEGLHLIIEYPVKVLSFHYSMIDFTATDDFKYRYKLSPFDPDYIDGGNDGSATYTNIPPGDYVFHVQGANSAGVWNTDGIAMSVRVLPPLWRTWWAYCIYAMSLAAAILLVKKWYDTNVLRIQADEIARERTIAADSALDEMQEQLEAQDSLVRNIRERNIATFDTVAKIIQHRSDYVPDELSAEIMRGSCTHVHALALLERSLKYYNDSLFADLHAFTADCLSDLSVAHEHSGSVTTINEVTSELISAENATLIGILIHELLSNAFQHAFPENSHARYLRVVMSYEDASADGSVKVRLKVQDSGSGIPEGIISELPGLSLVRQVVDHYRGVMEVASSNGTVITITCVFRTNVTTHSVSS